MASRWSTRSAGEKVSHAAGASALAATAVVQTKVLQLPQQGWVVGGNVSKRGAMGELHDAFAWLPLVSGHLCLFLDGLWLAVAWKAHFSACFDAGTAAFGDGSAHQNLQPALPATTPSRPSLMRRKLVPIWPARRSSRSITAIARGVCSGAWAHQPGGSAGG